MRWQVLLPLVFSVLHLTNLLLYLAAPYLGASAGLFFPPFPSWETIRTVTSGAVLGFIVYLPAVGVAIWLVFAAALRASAARCALELERLPAPLLGGIAAIVLMPPALHDWVVVLGVGLGQVLELPRRALAFDLVMASEANVQLVAISATVLALAKGFLATTRWRDMLLLWGLVVVAWAPFVVIGARKELVIAALGALFAAWPRIAVRRAATAVGIIASYVVWVVMARDSSSLYLAHEWLLPGYTAFAVWERAANSAVDAMRETVVWGWQFMLPSALRIVPVTDLGTQFKWTEWSGVGYGFSPVAEAILLNRTFWPAIFAVLGCIPILLAGISARLLWPLPIFIAANMVFWGRSELWLTIFFSFYEALLTVGLVGTVRVLWRSRR